MNTSALKSFAQKARTDLREAVENRLLYWGFDKKGNNTEAVDAVAGGYVFRGKVSDDTSVPGKWNKLKAAISNTSVDEVVEKAAYTWFNRLIAMKILGMNGYEAPQLDYLNEETTTPAILERARRGQFAFLSETEKKRLQPLLTDYEKEQEAFAILLIGYCHQHPLLQNIFGSIDDYTELLLPDDILTENGLLYYINTTDAISEEDYKQVELIGWLYQFYISEKKDEVFAGFKQNKKAEAKDIPAATQIFTPNWIVKYLVQNTLGRSWLDAHPASDLKNDWKYLVETSNEHAQTVAPVSLFATLEELTFLDPAVGSGHILVEAFDAIYPMYMAEYYSPDEAVQSILQHNLYGLDLDLRAVQLAQFALLLKAAQYSRTVLQGKLLPHIHAMPQHRNFSEEEVELFLGKENERYSPQVYKAFQTMEQANNLGSIMVLELSSEARRAVEERAGYWQQKQAANIDEEIVKEVFPDYLPILLILTNKFVCIAANPPYMGQKNMNAWLKNYVNRYYPLTKSDLFAVFMDVCNNLVKNGSRYGIINMQSWMFLSSYESLRMELLSTQTIESMLHLGPRTFDELSGEVVQNTAFILQKKKNRDSKGIYYRLVDFRNSDEKKKAFDRRLNSFKEIFQNNFSKIPGSPVAYWVSKQLLNAFLETKSISSEIDPSQGLATTNNDMFLRYWFEVSNKRIGFAFSDEEETVNSEFKWFPLNKGGGFRRWYGSNDFIIDYQNKGKRICDYIDNTPGVRVKSNGRVINTHKYFRDSIEWNRIGNSEFTVRINPGGFVFESASVNAFPSARLKFYYLALLNSNTTFSILSILSPTLTFQVGDVGRVPVKFNSDFEDVINKKVETNILISKLDWDSRETSWDFLNNFLIANDQITLELSYRKWLESISKYFFQLHENEEKLNGLFIEIYGLKDELTPEIPLKSISILQEELDYEALEQIQKPYEGQLVPIHADVLMEQLISYAVGCYMGRYRLDKPGLHIAHSNPTEEELLPYAVTTSEDKNYLFSIDDDAIIPLMGNNGSFTDDLLQRIKEFLTIIWGDDTLTANLNFLQQQLGKDLEDYLVKDFWKYHTRTYSKKPIYWLFSSKKGAFQVLVYMHRMNAYTPAKIRSKYLIPHISWLQNTIREMERNAASLSKAELKKLDALRKHQIECDEYDLLLKDIADKQISFDLDDGVTKNYALFEGVVAVIK